MSPVVDAHVHLSGRETSRQVLEALDDVRVDHACVIGPFLHPSSWIPMVGQALDEANAYLLERVAAAPDRLWALVTVDPRDPGAAGAVRGFADRPEVHGVKLIPHDWDPEDARDVYAACEDAGLPILFHSGIFISGRCSDRCRPARFEVVRDYPRLTVVLAHVGWPWVDEAIAVALMDRLRGEPSQIRLDLSPGTPPPYRKDTLHRALAVLGADPLLFASDLFCPFDSARLGERLDADRRLFEEAGATTDELAAIFGGNAATVFGTRYCRPAPTQR